MKAGVVHAPGDIRYEEVPKPVPQAGEVLVKVKYTGICGSDVPRVNGTACHYYPNILGHEFSGVVAELGDGVSGLAVGDKVAGIPLLPCMDCDDCRRGNFSLCEHYRFIGSSRFGSFAEYVALPASNLKKLEENVSFEQGAFFEPATVAVHGLRKAGYRGGTAVAVVGSGTVGIFTLQWAKIFGAKMAAAFDLLPNRLALAKEMGADAALDSAAPDVMDQVRELTQGRGFDYVFETSGAEQTIHLALEVAGNCATVCYIGTPKATLTFTEKQWEIINRRELKLVGSWMSYSMPFPGEEWSQTAHFFHSGALKMHASMIDRYMPLSRIDEAFRLFKTPGAVKGKILINSEE